jgi:hypothetical protein
MLARRMFNGAQSDYAWGARKKRANKCARARVLCAPRAQETRGLALCVWLQTHRIPQRQNISHEKQNMPSGTLHLRGARAVGRLGFSSIFSGHQCFARPAYIILCFFCILHLSLFPLTVVCIHSAYDMLHSFSMNPILCTLVT